MGYDMRWESDLSFEEQGRRDAAKAAYDAALAARKAAFERDGQPRTEDEFEAHPAQQEVRRTSRAYQEADGYFRLNIFGMALASDALWEAGAIHDKRHWPDLEDFGLSEYPEEDSEEFGGPPLTEAERKYLDAVEQVLAAGVEFPGIPIHKLGSNDGWLVTMPECVSAAKAWVDNRQRAVELLGDDHRGIGLADEFMAWAAEAARHGGFRVH